MSGVVTDNLFRASGSIAAVAGGLSWQSVVTASTITVSSGKGYFINTTSNACTITLPSSADAGDQIVLADYARTWGTNAITIDSNGLLFQGETDDFIVDYDTAGQAINLVYSGSTVGWTPASDIVSAYEPVQPPTQKAIFGFGIITPVTAITNLVSSSGVVATDTAGVGTARQGVGAASYGGDKAIFAFGNTGSYVSLSNLVNNSGVVATDVTGVGTVRAYLSAANYGGDKSIFGYGNTGSPTAITNLVSNAGVVATDTAGVGTARKQLAAASYGEDKVIFGFGDTGGPTVPTSLTNLVSNLGIVSADVTGVGQTRYSLAATGYGTDKAIFAYGYNSGRFRINNLVSNTGVVATDTTGVGTLRNETAAAGYGGDKALFGFGDTGGPAIGRISITNLVSNSGVVASDTAGVGQIRSFLAASGYSFSA